MILRIWHGAVPRARGDEYAAFTAGRAIPDYRGVPGNRAAAVLRRDEGDLSHFLTVSLWDSLDAIRAFAGDPVDRAKYYPEDAGFLIEFEPTVQHWTIVAEDHDAPRG